MSVLKNPGRRRAIAVATVAGAVTIAAFGLRVQGQGKAACDVGNGGITLPAGFCAQVVADNLGVARQMAVARNGDLYVALQTGGGRGQPETGGGAVALRDTNGDGRFDMVERFGAGSTTGIGLRNGYIYLAHPTSVERMKMTEGQLKPTGQAETIVSGFPTDRQHSDKGLAFDGRGSLYVNVGAPSNACQNPDRRPGVKGQDPCPLLDAHAGIWKYDENKLGQTHTPAARFASGMRQMPAITWHDGAIYVVMHNRDQLDVFWPALYNAKANAERPAEPMFRAVQGSNFGWPYCYYDYGMKTSILNPEYGGDGKTVGRCKDFTQPVAAFPAHWAPVDVKFYGGSQFPAVPERRIHRVPRFVEPLARASGRLQRHVPAVRERQGLRGLRGVRGGLCREGPAPQSRGGGGPARRCGRSAGRLAVHLGQPEGQDLARGVHGRPLTRKPPGGRPIGPGHPRAATRPRARRRRQP